MIVETDASDLGYGGILKQKPPGKNTEDLVRFASSLWPLARFTKELFYNTNITR